jgi:3-isopropylmalate dehydrogenase
MNDILLLPGDGIGPEVMREAQKVLMALAPELTFQQSLIGGAAYDETGSPLSETTLDHARNSRMVLLAAVGGPKWDQLDPALRPEQGLLKIRKSLALFANLRPAKLYPQLVNASSLKPERINDLDLIIVRELTGGLYFGEPRGIRQLPNGERQGFNTAVYSESEIVRIGRVAFELALKRDKKLCSVDKANVLEVTRLWREVMTDLGKREYPQVALSHLYADNALMQLIRAPKQFDVIVTGNMFGDLLSDAAAELTGSIGMLPSASLNDTGFGLYEPCHGSAPDIAGKGIANPLATLLSLAMGLRHSLRMSVQAQRLEDAIASVLASGLRTADIALPQDKVISTAAMGDAVVKALS